MKTTEYAIGYRSGMSYKYWTNNESAWFSPVMESAWTTFDFGAALALAGLLTKLEPRKPEMTVIPL